MEIRMREVMDVEKEFERRTAEKEREKKAQDEKKKKGKGVGAEDVEAVEGNGALDLERGEVGSSTAGKDNALSAATVAEAVPSSSSAAGPSTIAKAWSANRMKNTPLKERVNIRHCVICLENWTNGAQVMRLRCGHAFHKDCLKGWCEEHNEW
jgi:hypothetical protein